MFKFKSYNVKKVSEKNEKEQTKSSFSTGTLKKSSFSPSSSKGTKSSSSSSSSSSSFSNTGQKSSSTTFAKKEEIKAANNKQSPDYSRKIPKKTVTEWHKNATYSAKNETKKLVIPSPHKKLERK